MSNQAGNWSKPLSRPLRLKDGRELATLGDAADAVAEDIGIVANSAITEHAVELLLRAAETGRANDRRRATEEVQTLLLLCHRLAA